jgi:hypothetical protein
MIFVSRNKNERGSNKLRWRRVMELKSLLIDFPRNEWWTGKSNGRFFPWFVHGGGCDGDPY